MHNNLLRSAETWKVHVPKQVFIAANVACLVGWRLKRLNRENVEKSRAYLVFSCTATFNSKTVCVGNCHAWKRRQKTKRVWWHKKKKCAMVWARPFFSTHYSSQQIFKDLKENWRSLILRRHLGPYLPRLPAFACLTSAFQYLSGEPLLVESGGGGGAAVILGSLSDKNACY